MRVILLQDIKGVGKKFDVKEVKDGYARNFLFPRKLASAAGPAEIENLEKMKAGAEAKQKAQKNELVVLAQELSARELTFRLKFNAKGESFGSVGKDEIKKEIAMLLPEKIRGEISPQIKVDLQKPLKKAGQYELTVILAPGIQSRIKIILSPEE